MAAISNILANLGFNRGPFVTTEIDLEQPDQNCHTKQKESSPSTSLQNIINIKRYSSLQKLLAVIAYVLHFIHNTKHLSPVSTQHLTLIQLSRENLKLLEAVQHAHRDSQIDFEILPPSTGTTA